MNNLKPISQLQFEPLVVNKTVAILLHRGNKAACMVRFQSYEGACFKYSWFDCNGDNINPVIDTSRYIIINDFLENEESK